MHSFNRYRAKKPDFAALAKKHASFAQFVTVDDKGQAHIDFQNAAALRALTACLLKQDWGYDVELREDRLCPTLANRLDYLHHVLDLEPFLQSQRGNSRPLKVLDIGTGHIAIYPLLLHKLRPDAEIVGTGITEQIELDEVSFHHAVKTRQANDIPYQRLSLLRPAEGQPILFPIFEDVAAVHKQNATDSGATEGESSAIGAPRWDIVICNPPFFGSEEEMKEGQEAKIGGVPAAPTAAANELVTRGGEVAFVGQIIDESVQMGESCAYYTSLIGKYASLQPLVDHLRRAKIDNYFIKIVRQARTSRWVLGWSFSATRLPDSFIRPEAFMPGTSFARLLPPLNSFTHTPEPPVSALKLRQRVQEILASVELAPVPKTDTGGPESNLKVLVAPTRITWSRAARRQAARQGAGQAGDQVHAEADSRPLFEAEFQAVASQRETSAGVADRAFPMQVETQANRSELPTTDGEVSEGSASGGATLRLVWLEGRDRAVVEGLWKFVLTKAQLLGHNKVEQPGRDPQ